LEAYDGPQIVGMDLHRRRSVLVRMRPDGQKVATARIDNDPAELRKQIARAGECPRVVLEAAYGWYWAVDALEAAGAEVHLAHPLGVKGFASRPASPDYAYFCQVRHRIDGQRALLSVARKLARRCYHTLRDLGDEAWQPAT
jgi:hypothetical protein